MAFNYKTKPYEHQEEALLRSFNRKNYAYFMEMGCGKSKVLIDNNNNQKHKSKKNKVCIKARRLGSI